MTKVPIRFPNLCRCRLTDHTSQALAMPLLEEIEELTKPVFDLPDLEDDDVDGTASSTVFRRKKPDDDGDLVKRRRKAIDLCADNSAKYGGTKVSRDDIFDDSDLVGLADRRALGEEDSSEGNGNEDAHDAALTNDLEESDQRDRGTEHDDEMRHVDEDSMIDEDEDIQGTSDSGVDDSNSDLGNSDGEDEAKDPGSPLKEKPATINTLMNSVDKDKQQRKAASVYEQTRIWEQLLYLKIKVHAALRAFNQLPRGQLAKNLIKEADDDVVSGLKQAHKNAVKLASVLLEAEHLLLRSSSFTKSVIDGGGGTTDSNDEEIDSEDEEEIHSDSNDESDEGNITDEPTVEERVVNISHQPSTNLKSLSKRLHEKEKQFVKFRDSTLLKWDDRTKFIVSGRSKHASSDFSAFEKNDIVSRIEKICADKERLLKRSRTKKSDIERIGGNMEAEEDDEIYDDDDFYQMLLKELIDKKTNNTRDPVAMTRHYIEMQKLRSKRATKKVIDHRASKDRKIKYLPIAKLVNFHPAMPELVEWSNESRNELFKSIFT
ncbi:hypothetical protein KIN20_017154 [Parelaphostrongylus tenuis]|uniref:Protein AATF n=1 Tax=Parelaphostrongylus tenuis TaxID=148309 RepID=A0AAD5MI75_PARTN|nr:hypothetical protein KIN20_017154 [Parelaphostrongylus tenuis]